MNIILNDILYFNACMQLGIVPLNRYAERMEDVNKILSETDPEEARRCRRKFRKQWRNLARRSKNTAVEALGFGSTEPTRKQKRARKRRVVTQILRDHVYKKIRQDAEDNT